MANTIEKELYKYFMELSGAEKKSVLQMLKTFLKGRRDFPERITEIFEYVEMYYNTKRIHSSLNYLSPDVYEKKYYNCLT